MAGTEGTGTALASAGTAGSGIYAGFRKITGSNGDLYLKSDGTAFFVHDGGDPSGSSENDVFTFTVSDGTNDVTQTITVTVDAVDDTAPTVSGESVDI